MPADTDLPLAQFDGPQMMANEAPIDANDKSASDLAPVFDVPVNISAVLGRASMSVAQLLQLGQGRACSSSTARSARRSTSM